MLTRADRRRREAARFAITALLARSLGGCRQASPTMAGGKPAGYWIQALHDPDARTRQRAASKLGNVGPADAGALPALLEALRDSDPGVRQEVILALVKFGPPAEKAAPILADLQERDPNERVRSYAGRALKAMQRPRSFDEK